MSQQEKLQEMQKTLRLPGFYWSHDRYGIVIGSLYICASVNDDGQYDVTVDTIDQNGDFALNLQWESTESLEEVAPMLRRFLKEIFDKK